jgi:hypothetical protein
MTLLRWASTYSGPVGTNSIDSIFEYAATQTLHRLASALTDVVPQLLKDIDYDVIRMNERDKRYYIFNTALNENGAPKTVEINKRNIEFRTGTEIEKLTTPGTEELKRKVFAGYGLKDIFFDVIVYRVGRFSYYALQVSPFFEPMVD